MSIKRLFLDFPNPFPSNDSGGEVGLTLSQRAPAIEQPDLRQGASRRLSQRQDE